MLSLHACSYQCHIPNLGTFLFDVTAVRADGTLELGLHSNLEYRTVVSVVIETAGEWLHICSSDDRLQAQAIDDIPLDAAGDFAIIDPDRIGAGVVLHPPTVVTCVSDNDCNSPSRYY